LVKVLNTKQYLDPNKFRLVMLLYGLPGTGKTQFVGTCPVEETGIAACETGVGNGLLTIAHLGYDHIVPSSLSDLSEFCEGKIFKDKKILVIDSLSAMAKTFIKDAALSIPRTKGESPKRKMGVPELDDFGVIGSLTATLLNKLLVSHPESHIIVTATEKWDRPNENDPPGTESLFGPNLAGQMFTEAPALFDFVLRMRTRPVLRNPSDPKSRYNQRYFLTDREPGVIAKCRANNGRGKALLDREEIFELDEKDISRSKGGFKYMLEKILDGYK